MYAILIRRASVLWVFAIIASVLVAPPARAAEPGPTWVSPAAGQAVDISRGLTLAVNPVSGQTYTPPGSAGPYLFGLFKVQPDGSKVALYEDWANESRMDGPTWTLYPGSAGLNVLAQQQGAWTLELWARAYLGDATSQHWSEASIIDVQVVPFFIIGNPPSVIDPLNLTWGDYLTFLEQFYGGVANGVTAVKCGAAAPDLAQVGLDCVSLLWANLQPPLLRDAVSFVWSGAKCVIGANVSPATALAGCVGSGVITAKLLVFLAHQVLLSTPAGRDFLNQKMPIPSG